MSRALACTPGFGFVWVMLAAGVMVLGVQRWNHPLNVELGESAVAPNPVLPDARINLNHDDAAHLAILPGIGPRFADRIVAFREVAGPFKTVDDLQNVPGIGAKTIAALQKFAVAADAE